MIANGGIEHLLEAGLEHLPETPLDQAEGNGGFGGKFASDGLRPRQHILTRDDVVQQAELQRLLGAGHASGERHLDGS